MIWTLITIALIIIGIVVLVECDSCNNLRFTLGVASLLVGIFIGFIIGVIAITHHIAVNKDIYEAEIQYESLTKQLQTINSEYEDVSKGEIIQKVYNWNTKVYRLKYWTDSPWTNWLYSKKYADSLKYIELEETEKKDVKTDSVDSNFGPMYMGKYTTCPQYKKEIVLEGVM